MIEANQLNFTRLTDISHFVSSRRAMWGLIFHQVLYCVNIVVLTNVRESALALKRIHMCYNVFKNIFKRYYVWAEAFHKSAISSYNLHLISVASVANIFRKRPTKKWIWAPQQRALQIVSTVLSHSLTTLNKSGNISIAQNCFVKTFAAFHECFLYVL